MGQQLQQQHRAIGPQQVLQKPMHEMPELFVRRIGRIGSDLDQSPAGRRHRPPDHGRVEMLLVAEVIIDGRDIGTAAAADLARVAPR